jgi:hypothetical protein
MIQCLKEDLLEMALNSDGVQECRGKDRSVNITS